MAQATTAGDVADRVTLLLADLDDDARRRVLNDVAGRFGLGSLWTTIIAFDLLAGACAAPNYGPPMGGRLTIG